MKIDKKQIEALAAQGMQVKEIAQTLGISTATVYRFYKAEKIRWQSVVKRLLEHRRAFEIAEELGCSHSRISNIIAQIKAAK